MLQHVSEFHSFLGLNNIQWYGYTPCGVPIPLLGLSVTVINNAVTNIGLLTKVQFDSYDVVKTKITFSFYFRWKKFLRCIRSQVLLTFIIRFKL